MKKLLIIATAVFAMAGCGKENVYSTDYASAVFINASTSTTGTVARPLHVYIDTTIKTGSALSFRGNSGYLGIVPGTRKIELRPSTDLTSSFFTSNAESFTTNTASTFVLYDTLSSSATSLKSVRLSDDLSLPADGSIKVRFLHLAPTAPAVDVTLVRTTVTPNDSITISNRSYIGASPNATALSAFAAIPQGSYTARVKLAGTQTLVLSSAVSALNTRYGIFTLYAAGLAQGQPLTVNAVRHY